MVRRGLIYFALMFVGCLIGVWALAMAMQPVVGM